MKSNESFLLQVSIDYPWVADCVPNIHSDSCTIPGPTYEVLDFLLRAIHVSYQLVEYRTQPAHYDVASIAPLYNESFDGHFMLWVINKERQAIYNISEPILIGSYETAVLVHDALHSSTASFMERSLDLFQVYDVYVWTCLLVMVIGGRIMLRLISEYYSQLGRAWMTIIFGLSVMLLIGLFRSGLLAQLLLDKPSFLFTDTAGFINALSNEEIQLLVWKDWIYLKYMDNPQSAVHPMLYAMHQALLKNPPKFIANYELTVLNSMLHDNRNVLLVNWLTDLEIPRHNLGFVFPDGFTSNQMKAFNKKISFHRNVLDTIQARYTNAITASNISHMAKCPNLNDAMGKINQLGLPNLSGCFMLLVGGLIFASCGIALEYGMYRRRKGKTNN